MRFSGGFVWKKTFSCWEISLSGIYLLSLSLRKKKSWTKCSFNLKCEVKKGSFPVLSTLRGIYNAYLQWMRRLMLQMVLLDRTRHVNSVSWVWNLCVCVTECKCIGRDSIKNGREGRVGVFAHRWPLGGGILIVHCSLLLSPAGITHLGPKHYIIVSTPFFIPTLCSEKIWEDPFQSWHKKSASH